MTLRELLEAKPRPQLLLGQGVPLLEPCLAARQDLGPVCPPRGWVVAPALGGLHGLANPVA
eukprot:8780703-Lingulodinium_polyedra.AAC.1